MNPGKFTIHVDRYSKKWKKIPLDADGKSCLELNPSAPEGDEPMSSRTSLSPPTALPFVVGLLPDPAACLFRFSQPIHSHSAIRTNSKQVALIPSPAA
jgi:hypothetical protein